MAERTALVFDERCVLHSPPPGVPGIPLPDWATVETFERPERLTLSRRVLEGSGVLAHVDELPARFATEDELRLAHTPEHVARVLEAEGVASFEKSFDELLGVLETRAAQLTD